MVGRPHLSYPFSLACAFLASGIAAQTPEPPANVWLISKVRDFKEANPSDTGDTHPHFNIYIACSAMESGAETVEDALDVDQAVDGGVLPDDNRGPRLRNDMPAGLARCFSPANRFGDWFQDRGPTINRSFRVDLMFTRDAATGLYVHHSPEFFPIDQGAAYRKFHTVDPDPFGHLQTDTLDGKDLTRHNYGFTMEFHTRIIYAADAGHRLSFQGDDDIWVFLNGRKVVDLGGVHQTQSATVSLDSAAAALGLQDGQSYPLDFFFAERHTASSSIRITANLDLSAVSIRRGAPGRSAALKVAAGTPVEIFDRAGRLVRALVPDRELAADRLWDGKDSSGRHAAPGVYFWRSKAGAGPAPALSGTLVRSGRPG